MGSELLGMLYILSFGICVFFAARTLLAQDENAKALSWASGTAPQKSKSGIIEFSRSLVHQFTLQHALRFRSPSYRKAVERKIATAGLAGELNVDEFIGLQILYGILMPALLILLNFSLALGYPWPLLIGTSLLGFYLPHMHCRANRNKRVTSVLVDLPFFIDLLALSTEAGLDFQGAIQRIVEKTRGGSVLADELDSVLRDITLGSSRAQALKGLSFRLDIGEVSSFVNVLVDADQTGASIAKVLKDQSIQMRLERFVRAEKAGARASQLILIPLMLFILPAVFIIVFAPVVLNFMYGPK